MAQAETSKVKWGEGEREGEKGRESGREREGWRDREGEWERERDGEKGRESERERGMERKGGRVRERGMERKGGSGVVGDHYRFPRLGYIIQRSKAPPTYFCLVIMWTRSAMRMLKHTPTNQLSLLQ